MNTKLKIAIAAGATLLVGVGGYLMYRKYAKRDEAARKYLGEVDENGGNAPSPSIAPKSTRTLRNNLAVRRVDAVDIASVASPRVRV